MRPMRGKIRSIWICMLFCFGIFFVIDISFDMVENVSAGTTLYVNTTGDGGAYTSIQDAINASSDGDTVFVYEGTYNERITINKKITLMGMDQEDTIIDGGWYGNVVNITVDWVNISGFYILGGYFGDSGIYLNNVKYCNVNNNAFYNGQGHSVFLKNTNESNISNNTVMGTNYGLYLLNSYKNNIMHNLIYRCDYGLFLQNSFLNNIFYNNLSYDNRYGIYLNYSINNNITYNYVSSNVDGVWLSASHQNYIKNNNLIGGWGSIHVYNSNSNIIDTNYIQCHGHGLELDLSQNNIITNNTFYESSIFISGDNTDFWNTHFIDISNKVNGKPIYYFKDQIGGSIPQGVGQVILANCTEILIDNQELSYTSVGVLVGFSTNCLIVNCNSSNNNLYGLYFYNSSKNSIVHSNFSASWGDGIYFLKSHINNVTANNISKCDNGIFLHSSNENNITDNNVSLNYNFGILLFNSSNDNVLTNNNVSSNEHGIYLSSSKDNLVLANTAISNDRCGIHLYHSGENSINENNASYNRYGIYIENSLGINIENNTMMENGIFLIGDSLEHWNTHFIDTSNLVNTKPLYYWKNQTDNKIPSDAGQVILANCSNIDVENQELDNSSVGIEIGYSTNINITNNNITGNWKGMIVWNSTNCEIIGNNLLLNKEGMLIEFSDFNRIERNTASENYDGIRLYSSNFTNLINNTVSNQENSGISISYSKGHNIKNNTAYNNKYGILVGVSNWTNVSGNIVFNNEDYGIYISRSNHNNITSNNISENNGRGLYLYGSKHNNISSNYLESNIYGIFLSDSQKNSIFSNYFANDQGNIIFRYSNWNTISNNTLYGAYFSIDIEGTGNSVIYNNIMGFFTNRGIDLSSYWDNITANNISNTHVGIETYGGGYYNITNNLITNNHDGIVIGRTMDPGTIIKDNNISYNQDSGILISESITQEISNNILIENGIRIFGKSLEQWVAHDIQISNTVNGKPVYYWKNRTSGVIPPGAGQVILANCSEVRVENQELKNASWGIQLGHSSNNTIINNNASFNYNNGIVLYYSNNNTIKNNNFSFNFWYGIELQESNLNNIINNTVSHNTWYGIRIWKSHKNNITGNNVSYTLGSPISSGGGDGLYISGSNGNYLINNNILFNDADGIWMSGSDENNIEFNKISENKNGIYSSYSDWNAIHNNNITSNSDGIDLRYSSHNLIYHNNFLDNSVQTWDNRNDNLWDNGYAFGGNYWSNYNGSDNYSGQNQDIPGSDGIGDINYTIDSDSIDRYPLMEPFPNIFSPRIELSQGNNSAVKPGVVLDFIINAMDLDYVNYSIDGGPLATFLSPYDINTTGWIEGVHEIFVAAYDKNNDSTLMTFIIYIDSIKPIIILNSPNNNSVVSWDTFLNFSIIDANLDRVDYTINGGDGIYLPAPYNISTVGWVDGNYTIQINAVDLAGNSNSSWYLFTIDDKPTIILNDPDNYSIIPNGTILDFSIIDINLTTANYSVNGVINISFTDPFDIQTTGWEDGEYTIQINAMDSLGNSNSSSYIFVIDSTKPLIQLNSPSNNSSVHSGTILDFSIIDPHFWYVYYKINGVGSIGLADPFNISTSGWNEGNYTITISANDLAGNLNISSYSFTIDDNPVILLNNPANNSVIRNGTILDFLITDSTLLDSNYSINGGGSISFMEPYNISTVDWADGNYTVQINALDSQGNSNSLWFSFTIDSTKPTIYLSSPENNTYISTGTYLFFAINDPHLIHANYSVEGGSNITFFEPYVIYTFSWSEGNYTVWINAKDQAGNSNSSLFIITVDNVLPLIQLNYPLNNSINLAGTILNFSIIDTYFDKANYSIDGGSEIPLFYPFNISTTGWSDGDHFIQINALDKAGNLNSSSYSFTIDSTPPEIYLNYPENNTVIKNGTLLNFHVMDPHLYQVNYSINAGADLPFSHPYDISTSGWIDGGYTIQINALDDLGNLNNSWFFFTIDSTKPVILFNSPGNNSVFHNGTPLDFSIIDANLLQVNYSINGGPHISLSDPFDISTSGWDDGDYTIEINSEDMAGNINSSWFFIAVDSTVPLILLISPGNNTVIPSGTIIDFYITDNNLLETNYSINGGADITFSEPYNVSTSGWNDGDYVIQVNALDMDGNSRSSLYLFKIDSTKPVINLNSPSNLSHIPSGVILNFFVTDVNLMHVNYSINGEANISFSDPFDISTSGWSDGDYIIQINAKDLAENTHSLWFIFTLDSTLPIIDLNSPENNSIIQSGSILDFSVMDLNLNQVIYSVNGESNLPLSDPFNISTIGWDDGYYSIQINVTDLAGNSNSSLYFFTLDSTKPAIELNYPLNNSYFLPGTILDFTISDLNLFEVNYSINDGPVLSFSDPYNISTSGWADGAYQIHINASDLAGNFKYSFFLFTIDSEVPIIILNSPLNNSFILRGLVLDFSIYDDNLMQANYSIDGGPYLPFSDPFNISTASWFDDVYKIYINALDLAGNFNSTFFIFTIDSNKPTIVLNSPMNNSLIFQGIVLDFTINDISLLHVNYSINGGPANTITSPFNISVLGWPDGNYTIQINAIDLAGNSESVWFFFSMDSKVPTIVINDPMQNSVIQSGTVLNFIVEDQNLTLVNYSINGGVNLLLNDPYDISTVGWPDGGYTIIMRALDMAGNLNSSGFFFTLDSTKPDIFLKSPENNSLISNKTIIEFIVTDSNLKHVNYSINSGDNISASNIFNISTEEWTDGNYSVQINAIDLAGNSISVWFWFFIDATPPSIGFDSSLNHSTIGAGTTIQIYVSDENINKVMYSIDQGEYFLLTSPYIIDTTSWSDGAHTVHIQANDTAGNKILNWFEIIVDSTPPFVVSSQPQNQALDIETSTSIIITFSESMDQANVEDYLTFSPSVEYSYLWEEDATVLNISFGSNKLVEGINYILTINKQIKDLNGNPMISDFDLEFTTKTSTPVPTPKSEEPEFPYWILAIVAIVAVVLILLFFLLAKRKGEKEEPKVEPEERSPMVIEGEADVGEGEQAGEGISWIQEGAVPPEVPPPTIAPIKPQPQVKCPRCNGMFAIDTTVVPYIMNCPNCGLRGKVERKF